MSKLEAVDLDIWEFVRLMVLCEQRAEQAGYQRLLSRFGDAWSDIDARLTELHAQDHQAYSDLMLNTSIKLSIADKSDYQLIIEAFQQVITELEALLAPCELPEERHNFESEILALNKQIKKIKKALG